MEIAVIGTGYVGLVAGSCLADTGNVVSCVDIDATKVSRLNAGDVPIHEPGLDEIVRNNVAAKRLRFTTDFEGAIRRAEVVFVAVGTPQAAYGSADVSAVLAVAAQIGQTLTSYKVVVLKSTVPIGTNAAVRAKIKEHTSAPFDVVSNPEFLKEGAAVDDFLKPDRVVLGSDSDRATAVVREIYEPFVRSGKPVLVMDPTSAEMAKYAANTMLATRISFMNEIAQLCDATGADVEAVRKAMGADTRIGPQFLFAGAGYGGSCFPKDILALAGIGRSCGVQMRITEAVDAVNKDQRRLLAERILQRLAPASGKRVAIWGLSFKPKTDDIREAPALAIIEALLEAGVRVTAFDPVAMDATRAVFDTRISFAPDAYGALEGADACVLVTEWNEFRHPEFERMKHMLSAPLLFDCRNVWDPQRMTALGFEYHGVGRQAVARCAPR